MIQAHLVNRDDRGWVDVLPGVMLAFNEMEQGQHGYSASQVMLGQGMNLPTDLTHGTESKKKPDQHQFVKNMGRELKEILGKVQPFNKSKEKVAVNLFKEGDSIHKRQPPMERTHKLSPKWRGPFKVTKIPHPFQVHYADEGREKVTHVRNCKRFREPANSGNPSSIVATECQLSDPGQCRVRRQRKMSRHIIDVLAKGFKWTFHDPDHFPKWLREREVNAGDIYIRGVPGWNHSGSTEVADFLAKELRLPKPLYKWKKRKSVYVQK